MAESQRSSISTSGRAIAEGGVVTSLAGRAKSPNYGFGFYGPGDPLPPMASGEPIRQWDFQPGFNTTQTPRHAEPFSFAHLRAFANVELVRMAIETRKDQLEPLDWMIKPRDNKRSSQADPRIKAISEFLAKPDGVTPFPSFMRALDEDLLAIDAPAIECVRTRGGKLIGLEYVDGATINRLVDDRGRPPRGPDDIAFQQVIRGIVWANLANRDLIYCPRNIRSNHIYGFGPVEQIIVTINTILKRQASQLSYFTEGNVPAGILNAPENWTNEQIRDLQEWFDQRIAGNQAEQRKLIWVPKDSKYQGFKDAPIKDDFDEWLARVVAFAFSLPPTPFVRQMNKGTANEDQDRALEEGLKPLKFWRKRLIDGIIADEFGAPDLEFAYREDETIDPVQQAEIDDRNLKNGSAIIDEVRDKRGQDPLPDGLGQKAMIYLGDTPIPLDAIQGLIERKTAPPSPPPGQEGNAPGKEPAAGGNGNEPPANDAEPSEKLAKADLPEGALALSVDRPKALRAAAALNRSIKPILKKAGIDCAAQIERKLEKAERDPNLEAERIADAIDLEMLLDLGDIIEAEIELIGLDAVSIALGSIGVDSADELVNQVNEAAVEWARSRAAELVSVDGEESLIASTREMIRRIIAQGLADNIGRDAIADNIQSGAAFSETRSLLIANTEIAMANGAAKGIAWDAAKAEGSQMVKQWFVSGEGGVCLICLANEAEGEIPYGEKFESGDKMEPAHPACRCVTTARVIEPKAAAPQPEAAAAE